MNDALINYRNRIRKAGPGEVETLKTLIISEHLVEISAHLEDIAAQLAKIVDRVPNAWRGERMGGGHDPLD